MAFGASRESNLGKGSLLGSDAGRKSAGGESKLGSGSLLGSDRRRLSASEEIAKEFEAKPRAQNIASAADMLCKVKSGGDHGDGTYDVELSAGGGEMLAVPAQQGLIVFEESWYTLQRNGPGWVLSNPAPYSAG